jgi:4a-hydroxytetrahydrobiopterin dehydratase
MSPIPAQDKQLLTPRLIEQEALADWRVLMSALHARFRTGDFATGVALVDRIGAVAEEMDHHPDIDLSYPQVDVRLSSHDVGGLTQRDVRLARRTSQIAAELGVAAETATLQVVEFGLDTPDREAVKPFWRAVLGLADSSEPDELVDPAGRTPTVWFQDSEPHDPPHHRWHLDIRVPPEVVEQRIGAALAAGGTLVSDAAAPRFWVLADAQGNKACLTTWRGRGDDAPGG